MLTRSVLGTIILFLRSACGFCAAPVHTQSVSFDKPILLLLAICSEARSLLTFGGCMDRNEAVEKFVKTAIELGVPKSKLVQLADAVVDLVYLTDTNIVFRLVNVVNNYDTVSKM